MSVSLSRFVNVMTGGRKSKDWDFKPVHNKDDKIGGILDQMDTELAKVMALGIPVEPVWIKLRDDLERVQVRTGGRKGQKLLDYLDGIEKRGRKSLVDIKV